MPISAPHFLLFSESKRKQREGQWRFVLQSVDGKEQFEAADSEPQLSGERLELLAVVRGLEALPAPARVTLITPSKYVNRGLNFGLREWRTNGWQWEHFGEMVPVKNRDLWQRVNRALEFHQVECRTWRFDLPTGTPEQVDASPALAPPAVAAAQTLQLNRRRPLRSRILRCNLAFRRWIAERIDGIYLWAAQAGTRLIPQPWLE